MRPKIFLVLVTALVIFLAACGSQEKAKTEKMAGTYRPGTFGFDLNFLQKHDKVLVLKTADGKGQVIVSAKFQGKVFTSTANGLAGKSFGWLNYEALAAPPDAHMNAYGGENRLWLGPEGNKFSLFFKPGTAMEFTNWFTPPAIDTESWPLTAQGTQKATLQKEATFLNYAGTELKIRLTRTIQILENAQIAALLQVPLTGLQAVGFRTDNSLTNTGSREWTKITGAPCLWLLDMFPPAPNTVIIIPYETKTTGKVATTNYFGEIPADRIRIKNGLILFKADGKARGKLGLSPERAKPMAGSYDFQHKVLTITVFTVDKNATYLNQAWNTRDDPFAGDAVNAYNDGPLADGSQMGPFYELESVSPAAFLKPGQTLKHQHTVLHFTGNEATLNRVAEKLLGISLTQVKTAF